MENSKGVRYEVRQDLTKDDIMDYFTFISFDVQRWSKRKISLDEWRNMLEYVFKQSGVDFHRPTTSTQWAEFVESWRGLLLQKYGFDIAEHRPRVFKKEITLPKGPDRVEVPHPELPSGRHSGFYLEQASGYQMKTQEGARQCHTCVHQGWHGIDPYCDWQCKATELHNCCGMYKSRSRG